MTFRNPVIKPQNKVQVTAVLTIIGPSLALLAPPTIAPFIPPYFPPAARIASQPLQSFVYNQGLYQQTIVPVNVLASGTFVPRALPPAQPYNLNLYAPTITPAPFVQYDWAKSARILAPRSDSFSSPIALYGLNPIPFAQLDWSKPFAVARIPTPVQLRNSLIYSEVPFNQPAWQPARSIQSLTAASASNLAISGVIVVPVPFAQYNWPSTFRVRATPRDNSVSTPLALFGLNPIPFALYDWSHPTKSLASISYTPQNPITITTPPPPASTLIQRTLTGVGL